MLTKKELLKNLIGMKVCNLSSGGFYYVQQIPIDAPIKFNYSIIKDVSEELMEVDTYSEQGNFIVTQYLSLVFVNSIEKV